MIQPRAGIEYTLYPLISEHQTKIKGQQNKKY